MSRSDNMTAEPDDIAAATDDLYRLRDLRAVLEPLRRLLDQVDEETRAAAGAAAAAGLTERRIAALVGASQPGVRDWLDKRHGTPLAPPSLETQVWVLHTVAGALLGLIARLEGRHLPEESPSSHHSRPVDSLRSAREAMEKVLASLARLGAALDYDAADGA
jgi:hypothetical protein